MTKGMTYQLGNPKSSIFNPSQIKVVEPDEINEIKKKILNWQCNNWRKMHGQPLLRGETKKQMRRIKIKDFNPKEYLTAPLGETTIK